MKYCLSFLLTVCMIIDSYSQDIIYTLSAELNNENITLDSILVENISNKTYKSFVDLPEQDNYQINLTQKSLWGITATNGVNEFNSNFEVSKNVAGELIISLNSVSPIRARFSIYNLNGQSLFQSPLKSLDAGGSVKIQLGQNGIYIVNVESTLGAMSFKGKGIQNGQGINVEATNYNPNRAHQKNAFLSFNSDFDFNVGDSMRISVYKDSNYANPESFNAINSDKINFVFESENPNTISLTGQIFIENSPDIDFSKMSVQSVKNTEPVKLNGSYQITNDTSTVFPLFVMNGDEVMFGFFPSASNNNIELDDILLFYIKVFPDITVLELSNAKIRELIRNDENYMLLKTKLLNALNQNSSPIQDLEFLELLYQTTANISISTESTLKNVMLGSDFEFEFSRNGLVKWPGSNPVYSHLGIEITNVTENKIVFGPQIISPKKYIVSLSSLIEYGLNSISQGNKTTSYELPYDDTYRVSFSNGNGTAQGISNGLNQTVYNQNNDFFIWNTVFLVVPYGTKKLFPKCFSSSVSSSFTVLKLGKDIMVSGPASNAKKTNWLYSVAESILKETKACSLDPNALKHLSTYFALLKNLDVFKKAETVTKLSTLARDFYGSDISGSEIRYFSNNQSFGELKKERMTPTKFSGNPKTEHRYEARISEKKFGYNKKVLIGETVFTKVESWQMATDLKFKASTIKGDAVVKNPETTVKNIGTIHVDATMGGDSSQVKIEPAFTSTHLKPDTITLISTGYPLGFLEVYDGNHQNGQPGRWLKDSIRVIAKDIKGRPMPGIKVSFSLACEGNEPCGLLSPTTSYIETNGKGIASVIWLLGNKEGYFNVNARVFENDTIPAVTFIATNKILIPAILDVIDSTNNQIGDKEKELPKPIQVIVKDNAGIPVPDMDVEFYFESDGYGTFNPWVATTNEKGIAESIWTLGWFGEQQRAKAKIVNNDTINPVQLFASTESPALYPVNGAYGPNILNLNNKRLSGGNFSMRANIPEGEELRVKIRGSFVYVLNHPTDNDWTWNQSGGGANLTVDFTSNHSGAVDFHLLINPAGVAIEVYENGDETPTWTR